MKVNKKKTVRESGSFRDPHGFVYYIKDDIFRSISYSYKKEYDFLKSKNIYKELQEKNLLIAHKEVKNNFRYSYKTITPQKVPFISYPYEWSFEQYKAAAIHTLQLQLVLLKNGMSLKDASAYNVQFINLNPIFIDSLSFEFFQKDQPWIAYNQYCKHFIAPLLISKYKGHSVAAALLKHYIDGIPIDLTSKLLPSHTWLNFSIATHIHIQSLISRKQSERKSVKRTSSFFGLEYHVSLIKNLIKLIENINVSDKTQWKNYYQFTNYSNKSFVKKEKLIHEYTKNIKYSTAIDIGGNNGYFSRMLVGDNKFVVSIDNDHASLNENFIISKEKKTKNYIPLFQDIINPSPNIGWRSAERLSFLSRKKFDLVMALAVTHHLFVSNNIELEEMAKFFAEYSQKYLIIEFIPKDDSKFTSISSHVAKQRLDGYSKLEFEKCFKNYFKILHSDKVAKSTRHLYLMKKIK